MTQSGMSRFLPELSGKELLKPALSGPGKAHACSFFRRVGDIGELSNRNID
jgi:hypothetical protein